MAPQINFPPENTTSMSDDQAFQLMFENHSSIMLLIEPQAGIILEANSAAINFYGYPKAILCGMSIDEINTLPPEQVAFERQKALAEKRNYFNFLHKLASGEERGVEVHSTPIDFQNSQVLFSIIYDVTGRKQADDALKKANLELEQRVMERTKELDRVNQDLQSKIRDQQRVEKALSESEDIYSGFIEQSTLGKMLIDEQGKYIKWNRAMEELTGISHAQALGTPAWEIQFACTPPELRAVVTMEKLKGGLLSALHSGESGFMGKPGESMIITAGGERKMVQQMTFLIKTSKGYCMGGMLQDITAKKEDETILKKRLELMEFSFEHSLNDLMQKAIDELEYLGSSSVGFFHILEDDQSSLKTSVWSTRTREEYLQAIVNQERVTQVGAAWEEVLRKKAPVIHNNGVTLGLRASSVLREIFLPIQRDGRIIAVLGVGNKPSDYTEREVEILTRFADYIGDIVERKIAEGGTQRMLDILETAQDLISSADLDGRLTYLNPAGRVMLGISPGTSLSNYRLTDFHSAEIAEIILEQALPQAQQVGHWEGESVIQSLQGRKYSVLQHIVAHRDGSGQISHYSTIVNDITDLKVADKALRDSEYRNRSLLNAIPDMMFRIGQDGTYLDYKADKNQQLYVPPEVFLGKKIEAVMPPDIHDLFRTEMAAAFQTETLHTFEYQLEVGGKLMFFEARVEANLNAAESIVIVRDITEQKQAHEGLLTAYDATIRGWSRAMDLRDQETEDHTQRVTELTVKLARSLNLPEEDIIQIRRGALLHDIGKLGIPDGILLKPGKLTKEEWVIMQQHPQYAYDMLSPITYLHPALDIPYCHHEKWDGSGYPRGLSGEQIPLAARLFAVVDVCSGPIKLDTPLRGRISNQNRGPLWQRDGNLQLRTKQSTCWN